MEKFHFACGRRLSAFESLNLLGNDSQCEVQKEPVREHVRGGPDEVGDLDLNGERVSRVNLDTVRVGEDGDGEVMSDGRLTVTDGLPGVRRNSLPDKVLSKVREASVPGGEIDAAVARRVTSVCSGGGDVCVETSEAMWDSGCTYTLLSEEDGRFWDGERHLTVRLRGFAGETRRGHGGSLGYGLMQATDGLWRVECLGPMYVVNGLEANLLGGRGLQENGLGGSLKPTGGAEMVNRAGVRYTLADAASGSGTYYASYFLLPTEYGREHVGQVVDPEVAPVCGPAAAAARTVTVAPSLSFSDSMLIDASACLRADAPKWFPREVLVSRARMNEEASEDGRASQMARVEEEAGVVELEETSPTAAADRGAEKEGRALTENVFPSGGSPGETSDDSNGPGKSKRGARGGGRAANSVAARNNTNPSTPPSEPEGEWQAPRTKSVKKKLKVLKTSGGTSGRAVGKKELKSGGSASASRSAGSWHKPSDGFGPKLSEKSVEFAVRSGPRSEGNERAERKTEATVMLCGVCEPTPATGKRTYAQAAAMPACSCEAKAGAVRLGGVLKGVKRPSEKARRRERQREQRAAPVSDATTRKRRMRQGVSGDTRMGARKYSSEEFEQRLRNMRRAHLKFNHASASKLNEMVKAGEIEGGMLVTTAILNCPSCWRAKMTKPSQSHKYPKSVAPRFGWEVEFDLFEPAKSCRRNPHGYRYVASFIDRAVGHKFAYSIKGKKAKDIMEAMNAYESKLREIGPEVQRKHGYWPRIETIVMDTEGGSTTTFGYRKSMVDAELIAKKIKRRFVGSGHVHAGKVERTQRSMDEGVAASLNESGLDDAYYHYAVQHHVVDHNNRRTAANRLGNGMAPNEWLGLRDYRPERLRPFGALAWRYCKNEEGVKDLGRGQRCVFVGYSGDVEAGYIVFDLDRKTLVAGPGIKVEGDLGGVRDLVTSIRADPFRVANEADWVWKLWRFEPRAVLKTPGVELSQGVIVDKLGAGGLPEFEKPGEEPSTITEERRKEGIRSGVIPTEPNSEPLILPHSQGTIGTNSNPDSRRGLLDRGEERPVESGNQAQRVTKENRKFGKAEDERVATLLIAEARRKRYSLRWAEYSKGAKTMSAERLEIYSHFRTFEEVDWARQAAMAYEHTARTAAQRSTDRIMSAGDLKNDVARRMCTFYTSSESGPKEVSLQSFADKLREKGAAPKSKWKKPVEEGVVEAAAEAGGGGGGGGGGGTTENRVIEVFEFAVGGSRTKKKGKKRSGSEPFPSVEPTDLSVGPTDTASGAGKTSQKVGAGKKKKSGSEPLLSVESTDSDFTFESTDNGKSSQTVGAGKSGRGKSSQQVGAGKGKKSGSGKSSQQVGAGKGKKSGSGKSSQKVGAGMKEKSGSEPLSSVESTDSDFTVESTDAVSGAGRKAEKPASRRSARGRPPVSYVGMTATPVEEKPTVCKAALPAEQVKPPRLRSVVKALEVKATANLARAEKEVEKVERAAQTEGRAGRLVAAAAKLLGYEEILGRLCTPKDAELIRANVAYCEVAMGVDSDRPSKASGEMPMWLVMAVKAKVQVEVDGRLEPMNMMDAVVMKEAPLWIGAARKEVAGLVALECWDEVERSSVPSGRTIAPCHFVLKIKTEEVVDEKTGQASLRFVKCKARLCYGGHMSRYGEDYDQTAAFVCNPKTIRSMLALAAPREYKVCSWDVSQAFVHSHYDEEDRVYMELPPLVRLDGSRVGSDGDEVEYEGCGGGKNRKTVAKLSRYLYGSKDAPRKWAQAVQAFCESIGAESLISDRMAFRWKWVDEKGQQHEMVFAVHVDDIVGTPSSDAIKEEFTKRMKERFGQTQVTGGEETEAVLGMAITRDWARKTITISQGGFVRKFLKNFGYEECKKKVDSPLPSNQEFEKWEGDPMEGELPMSFLCFVGSLNWLVCSTRPDLAHACAMMSRYASNPGPEHVKCAKHILAYLAGHKDLGITYHGSAEVLKKGYDHEDRLVASVDADLGGCKDTHKSTSGMVVWLNGGAISWSSKKQSTVSTSTTEAEMKAAARCSVEIVWLRDLVTELGAKQGCVRVLEDNQGVVQLTHGQKDTSRSGHFRRPQVYVEDLVGQGFIWLDRTETDFNPSDIFTKQVEPAKKFGYLRDVIMGIQPDMYLSASVKDMLSGREPRAANVLLQEMRQLQDAAP